VFAHVFGQDTHTNAGEVVDREAGVARVLGREKTLETWSQDLVSEPGLQGRQAHVLCKILEQDLDEDTAAGGGFLFVKMDHREDMPANGIVADHMSEEARNVAQTIRLVTVDGIVVFGKRSLEQVRPEPVDLCESLSDQTVKLGVCPFLGAALDDHRRQFWLQTGRQVDLHQFVTAFFEVDAGHDRQVDRPAQIDQVGVALVLDIHLLLFLV
jgi:hypothetical protein